MKELSQLNIVGILHYCWIIRKKNRGWSYKLGYIFVSCLWGQELSYSYSVLTSPTGFLLPISIFLWGFLIIFLNLKFLCFLFYFSASKAAKDFLTNFNNVFLVLSIPQATKATPFFSHLPTILMDLLHPFPLFSHFSFASYHSLIDCPPITLLSLILKVTRDQLTSN